ncbi:unnamed protein product [Protopolystoma xenopodis]|uniref:Uncharacterized protein n=1 Tax=Protopolystoma xenopodis TaxID=117903 RepID=A0A3S5AE47_9PLAT|nr:unnamed protein product [Protopolystoma xenopodis]
MAGLTNDVDYDSGDTDGNVPGPHSNSENYHNYYARGPCTR